MPQDIMISEVLKKIESLSKNLNKRFDAIDVILVDYGSRFDHIDCLFETIAQRFNQVDERFDSIDQRFDRVDQRFNNIESRIVTKNQFNALIDVLAIRQGVSGLEATRIKNIAG